MEPNKQSKSFSVTEEKTSVSFSDWSPKLIFDYSFTAKLILSDDRMKNAYAEIATELLKYEGVKPKTLWRGVAFFVGRERIAFVSIVDQKLCVRFPAELCGGRTQRIKGKESQRTLLQTLEEIARKKGLKKLEKINFKITADSFKTEPFNALLTKGLVKILKDGRSEESGEKRRCDLYGDTVDTQNLLLGRHGAYEDILALFGEGEGQARLSQKQILRSVDEIWVRAIEDCIPSLDELIRNPNHFIAETEDILPIEKTKRISGRSIAHLCRHTDYLSVKEDGDFTPTKMLNVFREDSLLTYENKFLNTLLHRLYSFVSRRYRVACEYSADERLENFEFENRFSFGEGRGRVKISVEYAEPNLSSEVKNSLLTTGLWKRVERLNDIVTGYIHSPFVKTMEKNFVRPPILRTNAILKNKYFRECLALWEFIESYDDAGYGIVVDEKVQELSEEYVRSAYASAAVQYMLFQHHTQHGFEDSEPDRDFVVPELTVSDSGRKHFTEEIIAERAEEVGGEDLNLILRVALEADRLYREEEETAEPTLPVKEEVCLPEEEAPAEENIPVEYGKERFESICREFVKYGKENFTEICYAFLRHRDIQMFYRRHTVRFMYGDTTLAILTFGDNSVRLYLSLPYGEIPQKFQAVRESGKRAVELAPSYLKIKSRRQLEYAKELAELLVRRYADIPTPTMPPRHPMGSMSADRTAEAAETLHALAVTEPRIRVPEPTSVPTDSSVNARHIAAEISGLIRPSGNYERPTEYGIDDTSAFILDEKNDTESDRVNEEELVP